ncbi:MAG: TRC40/GET3/ArsA family transport-energizing ATPase [Anaerolineae bacterium]|nr:TRC40/GET3/ArsA family transport-energizing ATPase [Anaerolineae bacterium]
MRIIVHTGKGGTGKTSISAATALRCAEMGYRTVVVSTDTAHSLADALDIKLGPEPVQVADNLWGQEIDAHYTLDRYWGQVQDYLVRLLTQRGADHIIAEEVTLLPGLEEGAHLLWINHYLNLNQFDVMVVDAAPTAETLRLLSLPDATRWWIEKIINLLTGRTAKVLRPLARTVGAELPDEEAATAVRELFDTLDKVRDLLSDPETASIRLVINAERMVIKETQRTYTYMNLYGFPVDAVICNRLIPAEVEDPYFAAWKAMQAENMTLIEEAFSPLPLLKAPMFNLEIGGLEMLQRLAETLYGDSDPARQMFAGLTHRIEPDGNGGYRLLVALPFADRDDMDLYRSADEITLRVGPYRRNIVLPYALWQLEIKDATFKDNTLNIHFIPA